VLFTIAIIAVGCWSGYVRYHLWRADWLYGQFDTPQPVILRPDYEAPAADAAAAREAIEHFRKASPPAENGKGGVGWQLSPDEKLSLAYLLCVVGEFDRVEAILREVIRDGSPRDPLVSQVAQLIQRRGGSEDEVLALYQDALQRHPELTGVRAQLAAWHLQNNRRDDAVKVWAGQADDEHADSSALLGAARFAAVTGEPEKAAALLERVVADKHATAEVLLAAATQFAQLQKPERAKELARKAAEVPTNRGESLVSAAGLMLQLQDVSAAGEMVERGLSRARKLGPHSARNSTFLRAAMLEFQMGRADQAKAILSEAADAAGPAPWVLSEIAGVLYGYAQQARDAQAAQLSLDLLGRARAIRPDSVVINMDVASVAFALGNNELAASAMIAAATNSTTNPIPAKQCAELMRAIGREADAAKWEAEAAKRAAALSTGNG
jgi:tetratricopeptide (TPR) repeat protein